MKRFKIKFNISFDIDNSIELANKLLNADYCKEIVLHSEYKVKPLINKGGVS